MPLVLTRGIFFRRKYYDERYQYYFKKCNKCDITNNNNRELCSIIDIATIEVVTITESEDIFFDSPLEDYFDNVKHEPIDGDKYDSFIRVAYIDNYHDIYNGCILVTWIENNIEESIDSSTEENCMESSREDTNED